MARKTLIELAAPALFGPGGAVAAVTLHGVMSAGQIAFQAKLAGVPGTFDVSDDAGKVRTFRDADDYLKQAGALSLVPDTLDVSFENLALVAPKPFTGDIIKKATSTVTAYTKRKADADARVVKLDQEIALMAADPTVPQARKDEVAAQKVAVVALSAFLAAEIARINAIINPGP